jgi:choline kinase
MVVSLSRASSWLRETPCVVSYSDIFYSQTAVESLMTSHADIAITYDPSWLNLWEKRFSNPLDDAETFRLHADSSLAEIGGRPSSIEEIEGQYMGLLRFTPAGWGELWRIKSGALNHDSDAIHMTAILQQVIEAGRVNIAAVPYREEWGEFDSIGDFTALSK